MRITKFMVDRDQIGGKGAFKVGTKWQRGWNSSEAEMPERRVDSFSWGWDTEPKHDLQGATRDFDCVILKEVDGNAYRLAFEVIAPASEITYDYDDDGNVIGAALAGKFFIGDDVNAKWNTQVIAKPELTDPIPLGKGFGQAGLIEIDGSAIINSANGNGDQGWFFLFYAGINDLEIDEASGEITGLKEGATPTLLHKITIKPDKDLIGWNLGSSMVGGPFQRKGGKWVGEGGDAAAGSGDGGTGDAGTTP